MEGRLSGEALVRTIFSLREDGLSHAAIAQKVGRGREWVRRVIVGLVLRDAAPEIERVELGDERRSCAGCRLRGPVVDRRTSCSLGYPEALAVASWARRCPVFMADELEAA